VLTVDGAALIVDTGGPASASRPHRIDRHHAALHGVAAGFDVQVIGPGCKGPTAATGGDWVDHGGAHLLP